jgi:DNA-binding IscR family transcriptional regulator
MVVLLLFNQNLIWTIEQIHDKTQIQSELLVQILYNLVKNKILVRVETNGDCEQVAIHMTERIKLAIDFKR